MTPSHTSLSLAGYIKRMFLRSTLARATMSDVDCADSSLISAVELKRGRMMSAAF